MTDYVREALKVAGYDSAEAEARQAEVNALRLAALEGSEEAIDALIELEDGDDKDPDSW